MNQLPPPSPFPLPRGERIEVRGKRNFLYYQVNHLEEVFCKKKDDLEKPPLFLLHQKYLLKKSLEARE
jgi:hypothetical protein